MNNIKEVRTLIEALELVDSLDLRDIEKFALINILSAYDWMRSNGTLVETSFKDIIDLFLDEIDDSRLHTKEEREFINNLIRDVK